MANIQWEKSVKLRSTALPILDGGWHRLVQDETTSCIFVHPLFKGCIRYNYWNGEAEMFYDLTFLANPRITKKMGDWGSPGQESLERAVIAAEVFFDFKNIFDTVEEISQQSREDEFILAFHENSHTIYLYVSNEMAKHFRDKIDKLPKGRSNPMIEEIGSEFGPFVWKITRIFRWEASKNEITRFVENWISTYKS